jgi:23S rRNA (adenine2503-C2)-methyltransferase
LGVTLDLSRAQTAPLTPRPVNLAGLTRAELVDAFTAAGIDKAKMRANQMPGAGSTITGSPTSRLMTDIAKETRAVLAEAFTLNRPEIVERQVSKDGTRKWLIRMAPGIEVETVYIPDVGRAGALCVSSQVGCTLNCTFCHTGTQALVRNLTAAEIVAQVQVARDDLEEWPSPKEDRRLSNIVFMGMGEPLYNLEQRGGRHRHHLRRRGHRHLAPADHGLDLGRGPGAGGAGRIAPRPCWPSPCTAPTTPCAKSPGATEQEIPDRDQLIEGIRAYPGLSNARRVTFEYVMLKGVNDSPAEALALVKLLKGLPAKINLIPFNQVAGDSTMSVPTGGRSRSSPPSSTAPATPRRSAPRAAATSWRPAAS